MEHRRQINLHEKMKLLLERRLGHKVVTSRDFSELSDSILEDTKAYISPITLRRFWGELAGGKYNVSPRRFTLDTISRYIGYDNWDSFAGNSCDCAASESSDYILNGNLPASELGEGALLELSWAPDRVVLIRSLGNSTFRVVESRNSKLSDADVFRTEMFVEGEPLLLTDLVHQGNAPVAYICGKIDGIRYRILDKEPVM